MAEFVMKDFAAEAGLSDRFFIDSAATSAEELGNPIYTPAKRVLDEHGISYDNRKARRISKSDYDRFDLIIAMEQYNVRNMLRIFGGDPDRKIHLLLDYTDRPGDVSDPWYTRDFQAAWNDIEEGCRALLQTLQAQDSSLR